MASCQEESRETDRNLKEFQERVGFWVEDLDGMRAFLLVRQAMLRRNPQMSLGFSLQSESLAFGGAWLAMCALILLGPPLLGGEKASQTADTSSRSG